MELIDFYADWCRPCQNYAVTIDQAKNELPDVTIRKVNVDTNEKLAAEHKVVVLPTTVLMKDGEVLWRGEGVLSLSDLMSVVQEFGG